MNIFILDTDLKLNAAYHNDRHVIKMITEHCQMISTAYRQKYCNGNPVSDIFYKTTHLNHPCNKWVREKFDNLIYLVRLTKALIAEYEYRYEKLGKFQRAKDILAYFEDYTKSMIQITPFAKAMPNECKISGSAVDCYRDYYIKHKQHLASWKKRGAPSWYENQA